MFRRFFFEKINRRRPRTWASTGVLFIMIKVMIKVMIMALIMTLIMTLIMISNKVFL